CKLLFAGDCTVLLQECFVCGRRRPAKLKRAWSNDRSKTPVSELLKKRIDARYYTSRIGGNRRGYWFETGHAHLAHILTHRIERCSFESNARRAVWLEPEVRIPDHRCLCLPSQVVVGADGDSRNQRCTVRRDSFECDHPGQALKRFHIIVTLIPERRDPTRTFFLDSQPYVGIVDGRRVGRLSPKVVGIFPLELPPSHEELVRVVDPWTETASEVCFLPGRRRDVVKLCAR